jgi:hypothetical protein
LIFSEFLKEALKAAGFPSIIPLETLKVTCKNTEKCQYFGEKYCKMANCPLFYCRSFLLQLYSCDTIFSATPVQFIGKPCRHLNNLVRTIDVGNPRKILTRFQVFVPLVVHIRT